MHGKGIYFDNLIYTPGDEIVVKYSGDESCILSGRCDWTDDAGRNSVGFTASFDDGLEAAKEALDGVVDRAVSAFVRSDTNFDTYVTVNPRTDRIVIVKVEWLK